MISFFECFFSVCGYNNQYSFEDFGAPDIEYVENFARTELVQLLKVHCDKMEITLNEHIMKSFFGSHAFEPQNFKIKQEEKENLSSISIIVSEQKGIHLESTEIEDISKEWESFRGWYFNDYENDDRKVVQAPKEALNLFTQLAAIAENNSLRPKHGYRYTNAVKRFYVYQRLLSGPSAYKTLHANSFGVIPSISSINKYVHRPDHGLIEGQLRNEELLVYLKERNQPLWVCLSEDATHIENRIEYDPRTNQLIGFVLPLNEENGMPEPFVYKAESAAQIIQHFNEPISDSINTIMAQPLRGAPSFCLMLFGSLNRYTADHVSKRWQHIVNELKKLGIGVLSISSDSDPKFNKAMRMNSQLGQLSPSLPSNNLFRCGSATGGPFYVQDTPHLGTKLRNFILKTFSKPKKVVFGRYFVKMSHLQYLVDNFSKDQHLLTPTVLNPVDRQNVESVLRIIDCRVLNMLKLHVKNSEGTVLFLQMMSNCIEAYMSENLSPIERIAQIWHALFIVRIWRQFVLNNPKLTLRENFISSNCYYCIEQNAHSMVLIILFLNNNNLPELFVPQFFSSQPCESFYRRLRSFCPTFSMIATCSVKGAMARVSKAQLLNEISNDNEGNFVFPQNYRAAKNAKYSTKTTNIDLPSQNEIIKTILKSKSDAIKSAEKIGLIDKKSKFEEKSCFCQVKSSIPNEKHKLPLISVPKEENLKLDDDIKFKYLFANLSLKNYASKFENKMLDEKSSYVEIPFVKCKGKFIVLKTSLCWVLSKGGIKLSSDRLLRVKQSGALKNKAKTKKKRRVKLYCVK